MTPLTRAIESAAVVHDDQTDKAGVPYILHPLRLMLRAATEDERIVAVLHDVVEDSPVSVEEIRHGWGITIADAIDAISHRVNERYEDYIERVAQNPLATAVKVLDLEDNLDPRRDSTCLLSPATILKYARALARLRNGPPETERVTAGLISQHSGEAGSGVGSPKESN